MARAINRLSSKAVEAAQPDKANGKPTVIPDGANLFLQISRGRNGSINKSWLFKYQFGKARHELGLGWLPNVGLSDARALARKFRLQIIEGIDPLAARKEAKRTALAARANKAKAVTFRQCCDQYLAAHSKKWTSAKHLQQWENTLADACKTLGRLAVADIETAHIVKTLQPIWYTTTETATRLRGRIESVLGFATVRGYRTGDNPARWRGHLREVFPARSQLQQVEHHPALPFVEAPAFMADLRKHQSTLARTLEFTILTASRTAETLGATWDEIDLDKKLWTIPAARMKARNEHRVPLSKRVVEILNGLTRESVLVFSAGNKSESFDDSAMLDFLRTMRPDVTVHGFRSTFRDWAAERTGYPEIIAEMVLAHSVGTKVQKAYKRSDLLQKRANLMRDWNEFCSKPIPNRATVLSIKEARAVRH